MKSKLYVFEDRQLIDESIPQRLRKKLCSDGLTTSSQNRVMFCGLIGFDGEVAVFLPRSSNPKLIKKPEQILITVGLLLKALKRYLDTKQNAINADVIVADGVQGYDILGLAFALFEDYFHNGLYTRKNAERKINAGKTHWGKTINRSTLFLSENSSVYLDLEGSVKRLTTDSDITMIHAEVLRILNHKLGWLLNGEADVISDQLNHVSVSKLERSAKIKHLHQELTKAYSDRDMYLIKQLISFMEQSHTTDESAFVIGVKKFEGMWEHMLASIFENVFAVNHRLAKPVYRIEGALRQDRRRGQRTDIVLRDPAAGDIVVVDAKYYSANDIETAPGWPDLVKQYFYEKAIKSLYPASNIRNVFVFPGASGPIQSVHMTAHQTPHIRECDLDDENYPPITCIYLAPVEVLKNYTARRRIRLDLEPATALKKIT